MRVIDQALQQAGVVLNEALRHVGYQLVKCDQIDELRFLLLPGIAGTLRLPEVFVETGTYLGNTTAAAARYFREVHTIELQESLYRKARERFCDTDNVTCHHGSSSDVLRDLVESIHEPALFFLDAHWSGGVTAHGEVEVPLLEELEILRKREHDDFIIVDDARLIGKAGKTGLRFSREYPLTPFDWRDVTMGAIERALGNGLTVKECADKLLIDTSKRSRAQMLLHQSHASSPRPSS